jgi:starch synthase
MNVVLAHPGTQHSFRLAYELNKRQRLSKFITSLAISEDSVWRKLAGSRLDRRVVEGVEAAKVKSYPSLMALEAVMKLLSYESEEIYYKRNLSFQKRLIQNDLEEADTVIGFDTSSWELAKYCADNNKKFILDVTIGHSISKEKLFSRIRTRFPEWNDISFPKSEYLLELEKQEMDLATKIVVPGNFVRDTLIENGVDQTKIFVCPFGADLTLTGKPDREEHGDGVKFLFFGSMTARKGLPLLLEAWVASDKKDASLIVAGYGKIPDSVVIPPNVELVGPVLAGDRASLFNRADVFVFPSYFEGFARVLVEAAIFGLPIIGTYNSGASELIENDVGGFIVEEGNLVQLKEKIEYFISNPESIGSIAKEVRQRARNFTWEAYGERWESILG